MKDTSMSTDVHYMDIYYLNDETRAITVQLNGSEGTFYETLQPQEGRLFSIRARPGSIPWIKKWDYAVVLLSYCMPEDLPPSSRGPS
jgi:hypothetical protein